MALGIVLFALFGFFLSTEGAPVISSTPSPSFHSGASGSDVKWEQLSVTGADSCRVTSTGLPFEVYFSATSGGFLMTFVCADTSLLTSPSYTVSIECVDSVPSTSTADVTVTVSGNSPPQPASGSSLIETVTVDASTTYLTSSILHTVSVTDVDGDGITCSGSTTFLSVDPNDCKIRNTVDLRSLPLTSSEVVDVTVSDGVNPGVVFRRTFTFTNPNRAPVFSAALTSQINVQESVTSADTLFTFSATDAQSFSRTFSVNIGTSMFAFDTSAGTVKLASGKKFDYEAGTRTYIITCVATDTFFSSTASVTISITDANEAPTMTPTTASVSVVEGAAGVVSSVVSVACNDVDAGDSVMYNVLPGSTNSDYFTFPNPTTQTLSNLKALDREGSPTSPLTVTIVCTDTGGLSVTGQVTVTITDDNDNYPEFVPSSLTMKVYSGMSAGTILGTLQATDIDAGMNKVVEFSLSSPSPLVSVQPNGQVSLAQQLTSTYGTVLSFGVVATDKGVPAKSTTQTLNFIWNEPPVITNLPSSAQVPEDPAVPKLLFTLSTSDPENDVVTCAVTAVSPSGVAGSNAFEVRTISGTSNVYYTAASGLDRAVASSYVVTVTSSDGKGGTSSKQLTVEVTANTPPTPSCAGSAPFTAEIDVATAKVNDLVKTITVTDVENDAISFTMTASPNAGSFKSDGAGKILVARDLKLETTAVHTLTIGVSDNVNTPVMCTLHVTLINMNQPPVFTHHDSMVEWPDTTAAGTTLFQFTITDIQLFTVAWDISPQADAGFFQIDSTTYAIKLASGHAFDYETKTTQFVITCTADDTYFQSTSTVTIVVTDTNDPPYFQSGSVQITVDEGPANKVSFLPLYNAFDPDGDTLTYALVSSANAALFAIDATNGRLSNLAPLDFDDPAAPKSVKFQVTVTDPYGEKDTVDVTVFLSDINDNDPLFDMPQYEFKVGLSSKKGAQLGQMTVTDKDSNINAEWTLVVTSQTPSGYLTVEPDGRVFLSHVLDLDYGTLISLDVEARDKGTPARTSTVVIDVIWNEGPVIHNLPADAYAHEDWTAKQEIFPLSVSDLESDQFVCVKDKIVPNTAAFDVVDKAVNDYAVFYTGTVPLSAKDSPTYELTVRCYDENGETSKTLIITVRSNVAPVLACAPQASVTVDAMTKEQGDVIYTIAATDADLGDPLDYVISSTDFYVGKYSGIIKTSFSLKTATTDQFSVPITVSDPKHHAYCTLFVHLTNLNVAPVFSNLAETVEVPEDKAGGSSIYVISVVDPNIFTTNIDLTWTSTYKSKFDVVVSGKTATVKLAASTVLDYETSPNTFTLYFTASDGYLTSQEKTLTVVVTDVNEPPVFKKSIAHYYATFKEIDKPLEVQSLGCSVLDPDTNDKVTLTLTGTNADMFAITDQDNCQVTLLTEYDLDNGLSSPVTLTLKATDKAGLSAVGTATITITEINDNNPEFAGPSSFPIEVTDVAGDTLGSVAATDIDKNLNGKVSYSILSGPSNQLEADKYITFTSTGQFVLRQSMAEYAATENFQYLILATDYGVPPRSGTTTVNLVYDPILDITTTTAAPTNTTTTDSSSNSMLEEPLVIGLLVGLVCFGALLAILGGFFIYKYCCKSDPASKPYKRSPSSNDMDSRASTPVRLNKVSVHGLDSNGNGNLPLSGAAEGRKISTMVRPFF